jgi:hypothetical protein
MRKILIVPNFIFSFLILSVVIVPALILEKLREKNKIQEGHWEFAVSEY